MTSAGHVPTVIHSKPKSHRRSELKSSPHPNIVTKCKHMASFVLLLRIVSGLTLDRSLVRPLGRIWTWLTECLLLLPAVTLAVQLVRV
jgi:hypothetical protein